MPTRQQIRERAAGSLGLFVTSPVGSNSVGPSISIPKLSDLAVDNERFRWAYLYNQTNDQWRLITATSVSAQTVTVGRAFASSVNTDHSVGIYGVLSPDEWTDVINNDCLPDIYRPDRVTLPLTAGTTEYNATATASWLTDKGQIIRFRLRDDSDANNPIEAEAPVVYTQQVDDQVVKLNIPTFPASAKLIVEARRYYTALSTEAASVAAPDKLLRAKVKYEALKRVFHKLGPAAKRIYGMQIVLAEREMLEEEARFRGHTVHRDWSSEDDLPIGSGHEVAWSW